METALEQRTLRRSIIATLVVSLLGIVFGLLTGSRAILFDGMFSVIDAFMSMLALMVSGLAARQASARFQHGFWHLEPLVAALNGAILTLLCAYAFLNAVQGILEGGRELAFGPAILYALVVIVISLAMYLHERGICRRIDSVLLDIDARGWLMATLITAALLAAFVISLILERTPWAHWTPYTDVVLLAVLTLCFLPVPLGIVRRAMAEILLIAPQALDARIQAIMGEVIEREGLLDYTSHVARSGRGHFIAIHILADPAFGRGQGIEAFDEIRHRIGAALDIHPDKRWFTVCFTADRRWL